MKKAAGAVESGVDKAASTASRGIDYVGDKAVNAADKTVRTLVNPGPAIRGTVDATGCGVFGAASTTAGGIVYITEAANEGAIKTLDGLGAGIDAAAGAIVEPGMAARKVGAGMETGSRAVAGAVQAGASLVVDTAVYTGRFFADSKVLPTRIFHCPARERSFTRRFVHA
jgi:hypothetical protein